jgi:hypothetical protein
MLSSKSTKAKNTTPLGTYLIKENLSLSQNVLQLRQFQEIPFQRLGILVHLSQLVLQLFERCLYGK